MKEFTYQGLRYKRDNNGQWQFFNPTYNKWVYHQYNHPSVDGNHVYDADALEKMYKDKNLKETTTQDIATQQKRSSYNAPKIQNALITTQAKIKQVSNNAPTVENANALKQLQAQKQKEDEQARKEKELKQQEEARMQHLRNVGSDNTRVNINRDAFSKIPTMQENFQQWENITKSQKAAASQIVNSGDLAKHFPNLKDQYLSEENSHRPGGPLTMEELALEQIRTNPDFFKTLEERKYKDFQKREQESWDEMPWYMKGINTINALASDPITTLERGLLEFERPLAFQGLESTDPESFGEDARFYDKMLNRDENVLNNTLNYINPFRAASSAGQNLQQGDYGDAAIDFASVIPMIKGAKAGWKGMNAAMKISPASILDDFGVSALRSSSPLVQKMANKATVGNLLTGVGGYEAATNYFPGAYDAYSEGDWKEGNKNLFMGLAMGTPLALEARSSKIIPRTIQGVKGAYNDVATGDSFMNNYVNAWKNPAAGLDAEKSTAMFDKIMQSDNFTSAEKAMLKEYQYSSFPFSRPGPQQDAFNNLISKAELAFPQDAVLTRTFSSPSAFEGVTTNEAGQVTGITNQNRPLSFSAGNTGYKDAPTWGKDRIVLSGKNAKKVEGNFIKNRYEPIEEGYYRNIPEEELTVNDFSKQREIDASSKVGDNYYGTQRLSPEEVQAQAEAIYNKKVESYSKPSEWDRDITPEELVGKQRTGPEDLFTLDEAIEFAEGHNARRAEQLRLYADPANKEEAIQKLIGEAEQSFSQGQGPVNELEVMGSGFDMKVVGRFPNERGGVDYVVKPRNIRPLKKEPNNGRALTSISGDASMQNAISNVDDIASGPTSNLSISDNFNDTQNFTKEILQLDDAQKRALLRDNPDKVVTKYKDIWDNQDDAFSETHELFPQTRQGQQDAFDEGTAFAKKWMFKDSDKFDELNSAYKSGNEELMQLDMKRGTLENALSREMNAYIEPEIRQKAIAEFLKRDSNRQAFDIKNKNGYDPDFVKILVEQNPNDFQFQRLGNIQKQLESVNQKFGELQPEVYDNLRKINENVDPQFRDKVANIYAESLGENEMMPDMNFSQAEIHMGNIDDQSKLVQYGKFEPSYTNLSKSNKDYLDENLFKIEGVNRAGDSSIDGDIITLGSKPQLIGEQRFYKVMSNSGELASDPEYVRFVGSYMKSPYSVATTNVHEVAGHQGQKMFGNWMNKLQEYDPEMLYEIPMDKNELAKLFKEVLVEPVKGVTLDEAGVAKNIRTNQTWQSSPQELYADLTIARYDMAKQMMYAYDIPMEMAIKMLKDPRNEDRYVEWFIQHPQVQQHFKPDATVDMKKQILKYLPAVIIGAGYGISQGTDSKTPENKYGGNIKTLSKFIRK